MDAITLRAAGLAAVGAVVDDLDLRPSSLDVLSDRGSLMVRLAGTGLVARASTHTGRTRRDPAVWLERELRVARAAVAAGAPVVEPAVTVDAGPHLVRGTAVSLWHDLGDDDTRPGPRVVGRLLAAFHTATADGLADLAVLAPARDAVTDALGLLAERGQSEASTLEALRREHDAALAGVEGRGGRHVVLHGDAHPRNVRRGPAGWRWIDLEETCRGPVEWDLAVLAGTSGFNGRLAVSEYSRVSGAGEPTTAQLAPWQRLRRVQVAVWALGLAQTYPERYAAMAVGLLRAISG